MKRCIVFLAGAFDRLEEPIAPDDYIIAADGGLRHTQALGLTPDEILGDFDSLGYVPQDSRVFPVEKDDTDAMLAARRGLELGFRELVFYGSLDGPRVDHTMANFQMLQFLSDHGARGWLIGCNSICTVIQNEVFTLYPKEIGDFSVFCMGSTAEGVTLQGLYYPLTNGTLTCGFPLGVSNHFQRETAVISVRQGSLLLIWQRTAGMGWKPPAPSK